MITNIILLTVIAALLVVNSRTKEQLKKANNSARDYYNDYAHLNRTLKIKCELVDDLRQIIKEFKIK